MPSYSAIRSVSRALDVLQVLNRRRVSSIADIHADTKIPKSTIVRILETLQRAGYISHEERSSGYQVTSLTTSLSCGFHGDVLAVEAGRAWALQLTEQLLWPVAIAVPNRNAVMVRFSTIPVSPMSPFHATLNLRLSLTTRALGRAYLAFCPAAERQVLRAALTRSGDPEDQLAKNESYLRSVIAITRRNGFSERDPNVQPKTSSTIAVPIFSGKRVLATIGLTYFTSALPRAAAVSSFVAPLRAAAKGIESTIASMISVADSSRGRR